jgi:hypothetical protein
VHILLPKCFDRIPPHGCVVRYTVYPRRIEQCPPGGADTREVGRSVSTLQAFMLAPDANALLEIGLLAAGVAAGLSTFFGSSIFSSAGFSSSTLSLLTAFSFSVVLVFSSDNDYYGRELMILPCILSAGTLSKNTLTDNGLGRLSFHALQLFFRPTSNHDRTTAARLVRHTRSGPSFLNKNILVVVHPGCCFCLISFFSDAVMFFVSPSKVLPRVKIPVGACFPTTF